MKARMLATGSLAFNFISMDFEKPAEDVFLGEHGVAEN